MTTNPLLVFMLCPKANFFFSSLLLFFNILVCNINGIQVQHRGVIWLAAFGIMGAMDWDWLFL